MKAKNSLKDVHHLQACNEERAHLRKETNENMCHVSCYIPKSLQGAHFFKDDFKSRVGTYSGELAYS